MKRSFFIFIIVLMSAVMAGAQTFYGSTDVNAFREFRDKEFRNTEKTALKEEDFAGFKGLNYYAGDNNFKVRAKFTRTADEKHFQMPTSSGQMKSYVKYGILEFNIDGAAKTLAVYQADPATLKKYPEYADLLFIPFRDATNRTETYGGGRYIDIKIPAGQKEVTLDFNLAYNPKCAYGGDKWSCPIPPRENSLDVEIKAGEKRYAYTGAAAKKPESSGKN
jgi:uncharacterized protein